MTLAALFSDIRACSVCAEHLPLGPRPVIRASASARLLIVGHAPGSKVHASGVPWDDASGARLRSWLGLTADQFYDERHVAIMPMGLCYPGRAKGGDKPPRPECAPLWHDKVLAHLPDIRLTLLIGAYAQARYLQEARPKTLTETVRDWQVFESRGLIPLVHPSPRNGLWLKTNPWFETELVPQMRMRVHAALGISPISL
jgi:uracil-DNA glycosylase